MYSIKKYPLIEIESREYDDIDSYGNMDLNNKYQ